MPACLLLLNKKRYRKQFKFHDSSGKFLVRGEKILNFFTSPFYITRHPTKRDEESIRGDCGSKRNINNEIKTLSKVPRRLHK